MRKKFGYWLLLLLLLTFSLILWQLPLLLRAVPSRYVSLMPAPIQQISRRNITPILPTAAVSFAEAEDGGSTAAQTATSVPATPLVPPTVTEIREQATATPIPTETPTPSPTMTPLPPAARLEGIVHQFQTWNNCGPATLAMSLSYFGLHVRQSETGAFLKPNIEDRNVSPEEMVAFVNEQTDFEAIYRTNGSLETLKTLLANGIPVIVEVGIDPPGEYAWMEWYGHYLLVVAYDDATQVFNVYDSWLGTGREPGDTSTRTGRPRSYSDLDGYWRQFNRNYVALYRPEQREMVETIVGSNLDDATMWANALTQVQSELDGDPENPFLWFNLGTIHNARGEYESAATAFDRARQIGLPRRMLWYQFGPYEAYYQVGRYQDVTVLADVALDKPYVEEVLYYRGLAYAALGEIERARQDLEAARSFNPRFTPAGEALMALEG